MDGELQRTADEAAPTRRRRRRRVELSERPPMVTHWKPTGKKNYQVDMKPTVIRRPVAPPPRLACALPLGVGPTPLLPVKGSPLSVGPTPLLPAPSVKGSPLGVWPTNPLLPGPLGVGYMLPPCLATPKGSPLGVRLDLAGLSRSPLGVGDLVPPLARPRSLRRPEPGHVTSGGDASRRSSRQAMWRAPPPSPNSDPSSPKVCSPCRAGRCCRRQGLFPCGEGCRCALLLAWQPPSPPASPQLETPPSPLTSNPPEFVRAWGSVPRKCDPQEWRERQAGPDRRGANFAWMGWSYVSDFATTQSCYG